MTTLAASFAANGLATCTHVVPLTVCAAVRAEALATLSRSSWSLYYQMGRFGYGQLKNPIRAPWRRHMFPLPITGNVRQALVGVAGAVRAIGVPQQARLVELCAVVTFGGASAQDSHSDISAAVPDVRLEAQSSRSNSAECPNGSAVTKVAPLVSAWVALQPVTSEMGPTVVFPASHRRFAQRAIRLEAEYLAGAEFRQRMFRRHGNFTFFDDMDGVPTSALEAESDQYKAARRSEDTSREIAEFGTAPDPQEVLLGTGDTALMDCRVWHFGGPHAWTCQVPRVLLNATFDSEGAGMRKGFTYHGFEDLPVLRLGELTASPSHSWPSSVGESSPQR